MKAIIAAMVFAVPVLLLATEQPPQQAGDAKQSAAAPAEAVTVADFSHEKDVEAGEEFNKWTKEQGWKALIGNPVYFYIRDGALNMVTKAGPIFRKRTWYAIFNQDKLRHGIENQILLRISSPEFRLDPDRHPVLAFRMEPVTLPGREADMLDPDENDTAFCLLISFDARRHEYKGEEFPESIGYVWANRQWDEPVGSDPDYRPFIRYIAIGHGEQGLGKPHEFRRRIQNDWPMAYPEHRGQPVPDVIRVGLMIDSNTAKSTSHSRLSWVRFVGEEEPSDGDPSQEPEGGEAPAEPSPEPRPMQPTG